MPIVQHFLVFPPSATVGGVLRTYRERGCQWWWFLITQVDGQYRVCSFGSLLPYLTDRTPHIVHAIGGCPICSGVDPLLWTGTGALVEEALADPAICARIVGELPLAELPVREAETMELDPSDPEFWRWRYWGSTYGVTENGVLTGVSILQELGGLGGPSGPPVF